jgi:hypothetical protein
MQIKYETGTNNLANNEILGKPTSFRWNADASHSVKIYQLPFNTILYVSSRILLLFR